MPWLPPESKSNITTTSREQQLKENPRLAGALADADKIAAQRSPARQKQHRRALDLVHNVARNAINALLQAESQGYEWPTTDALVAELGGALPAGARRELAAFIDEIRPVLRSGDRNRPREAARRFAGELADRMVEAGWREPQRALPTSSGPTAGTDDTPESLAARVPRT